MTTATPTKRKPKTQKVLAPVPVAPVLNGPPVSDKAWATRPFCGIKWGAGIGDCVRRDHHAGPCIPLDHAEQVFINHDLYDKALTRLVETMIELDNHPDLATP